MGEWIEMACDALLVKRIETLLRRKRSVTQKKMFGGICFLVNGNMCCGVEGDKLVVRVGPEHYEQLLQRRHVKPMDFTGRPLRGFIYVMSEGLSGQKTLHSWLEWGIRYARSLPEKRRIVLTPTRRNPST
jgi:TfoX/Sxy family transcriptional regulator of competence genes